MPRKQTALCSGCLLGGTLGIKTCGREREGPQAAPARTALVGPECRPFYLRLERPSDRLPPEGCDPGQAALCRSPKHFLKELAAEGCPQTTIPEARATQPPLEGTWAAHLHAHRPRPSLAFLLNLLLGRNIWHQPAPRRGTLSKLTDANERRITEHRQPPFALHTFYL